jgi:dienelactone hydrolase
MKRMENSTVMNGMKRSVIFALLVALSWRAGCAAEKQFTGPWDVERIVNSDTPAIVDADGPIKAIRYRSEPYHGADSLVFAYYAVPEGAGPHPAMLLVHGGGGKAFREWAALWAARGYAALAMDLSGNGPDGKPIEHGGPAQDDGTKFKAFDGPGLKDTWPYQAVAAALRGHSFLNAQKEVDRDRIGVTGISWGGYLTCIVAGIDDRLKVAVPVYGCGFLAESSHWQQAGIFDRMAEDERHRWIENFDPSRYLPGVKCPILFVNGTNDFAYPLDSYQKSYQLVTSPRTLCVTVNMPHGHQPGWAPKEIGVFVDSILRDGKPLARLGPLTVDASNVSTQWTAASPVVKAQLHYSTDTGLWKERKWTSDTASVDSTAKNITATLPPTRPLTCFLTATDERGLIVSTDHLVLTQ